MVQEHQRHNRIGRDCWRVFGGCRRFLHLDTEKLAEFPWALRRFSSFYLMKYVTRRRLPGLNYIVIMPVAIDADMLSIVGEEIQSRTGRAFILIFVFPAGLGAGAFARFNMAESRRSTRHDVALWPEKLKFAWARPAGCLPAP